ncbi:MAG TPA: Gfo/Idh/MocA family oxidoreductase [Pirellulales bacterium]|nr:Gfo/Idh/MocA family oxidoreductase [Pirellulales bacterium]
MHRRAFHASAASAVAGLLMAKPRTHAASPRGKIKIGQIGTAHAHAAGKLAAIRKLADDYEVVGVVESDVARRERLSQQPPYAGLPWMTEEQLFAAPGLQAVAVETAVRELVPTALRSVEAGLHVHVDKPAGESMSAVRRLHEIAAGRARTVQMGYMFRYNPAFQLLFQAVREGWLGEIFEVDAVMSKALEGNERKRLLEYRGGSMFELGCHVIDQLVTVLGKPDRVTAYPRQTRSELDPLVDNQLAVFEYPHATAAVRSSLVEINGGPRRQFIVCGTEGTLEILPLEPPQAVLTLTKPCGAYRKGRQEVELPKMTGRYDDEFRDLAAVIRGEKPFAWSPQHDLVTHECILRASSLPVDT